MDPVLKEWESPYLCFSGNPIFISDKNGDDGKTAAVIAIVTQEVAGGAAATVVLAPLVPVIEAVGDIWALYELLKDASVPAPRPLTPPAPTTAPPLIKKADSKDVEKRTLTTTPKSEVKSRSAGTKDGERAGKDFTPKGKKDVWEQNKVDKGGKNECENCGTHVNRAPQSKKGVPTPEDAGQVDHIHPKVERGNGSPDSGQILCPRCNSTNSNNSPVPKTN